MNQENHAASANVTQEGAKEDVALDALEGQLRRGDGRLALALLREMKTTEKSRGKSAGAGSGPDAAKGTHRE